MTVRKLIGFICVLIFSCPVFAFVTAGNPQGKVTLTEYFDYQCPHCRDMSSTIDQLIKNNPDLRVVYRVVPFVNDTSWFEASAALAATRQGKFQTFHHLLMQQRQAPSQQDILLLAKQAGLDANKLYKNMHESAVTHQLNENLKLAQTLNINGVPTFLISKTGSKQTLVRYDGEVSIATLQQAIAKLD